MDLLPGSMPPNDKSMDFKPPSQGSPGILQKVLMDPKPRSTNSQQFMKSGDEAAPLRPLMHGGMGGDMGGGAPVAGSMPTVVPPMGPHQHMVNIGPRPGMGGGNGPMVPPGQMVGMAPTNQGGIPLGGGQGQGMDMR